MELILEDIETETIKVVTYSVADHGAEPGFDGLEWEPQHLTLVFKCTDAHPWTLASIEIEGHLANQYTSLEINPGAELGVCTALVANKIQPKWLREAVLQAWPVEGVAAAAGSRQP